MADRHANTRTTVVVWTILIISGGLIYTNYTFLKNEIVHIGIVVGTLLTFGIVLYLRSRVRS